MKRKTVRFSAALSIFLPILAAEAQDVDVPGNLTMGDSHGPTVGVILKAGVPFIHNFGGFDSFNTFMGKQAGNFTMTGRFNTASGSFALPRNTSGNSNTATGNGALFKNTTGSENTASGGGALSENTTGRGNTASGLNALFSNTVGDNNTALGGAALFSNINGTFNTANGYFALSSNAFGSENTASGHFALQGNNGNSNTAIGSNALTNNVTGNNNTALGSNANVSAGDLTNATAIGFEAVVNASNKIRFGNEAVTVIEGLVGFTANSDRNRQENFRAVRGEEVLRKIRRLSLSSWNYVGQEPTQFRHYGPAAQDFFDAFGNDGVGTIGTPNTITSTDIEGILMVAVQALERRTEENDALKALSLAKSRSWCWTRT